MTTPHPPVDPALPDLRTVRYGPGALMTPANALTIFRLALSPALFLLILRHESSWLTVGVWALLASTDGADGWLARRFGTTRSGAFLDPLADKALVLGAMVALVLTGTFWVVPVGLIMVREVAISLFRSLLARQGLAVPARPLRHNHRSCPRACRTPGGKPARHGSPSGSLEYCSASDGWCGGAATCLMFGSKSGSQ